MRARRTGNSNTVMNEALVGGTEAAIVGAAIGSIVPITEYSGRYSQKMLLAVAISYAIESLPSWMRVSTLLSCVLPADFVEGIAPVVDWAAAGFVVGFSARGMFAASKAIHVEAFAITAGAGLKGQFPAAGATNDGTAEAPKLKK